MWFLAHFYIHLDFKATQEFNLGINLDFKKQFLHILETTLI